MRNLLCSAATIAIMAIPTSGVGQNAIHTGFVRSCVKSMTAPPQALPAVLSANICLCTIARIVGNPASRLVLKTVEDTDRDYSVFQTDVKVCVSQELPKYMQSHPNFLQNYLRAHPEVLDSGSDR